MAVSSSAQLCSDLGTGIVMESITFTAGLAKFLNECNRLVYVTYRSICGDAYSRRLTIHQSVYCTVMVVDAVTPLAFAPIDVVPTPRVVATPATLGAFAIVATLAEDELQCVVSVMS
jgi:hypothetical protein